MELSNEMAHAIGQQILRTLNPYARQIAEYETQIHSWKSVMGLVLTEDEVETLCNACVSAATRSLAPNRQQTLDNLDRVRQMIMLGDSYRQALAWVEAY